MEPHVVRDAEGLADARRAFLEAVQAGEGHLEIELPPACLGLDGPGGPEVLELEAEPAAVPPPIDLTVRSRGGLCVLAGMGLRIAARSVRLEGVALIGAPAGALAVTAEQSVRLDDVIVLGGHVARDEPSAVTLQAAGETGTTAAVQNTVIARSPARDAGLRLASRAGSWFHAIGLHGVTVEADGADALVGIDSVRELRMSACRLSAGDARTLLRLLATAADGELAGCQLSASVGALVDVQHAFSPDPPPLRLTEGTAVTVLLSELPPALLGDPTVVEVAGATVDAAVQEAIGAAHGRVLSVDGRLGRLLEA